MRPSVTGASASATTAAKVFGWPSNASRAPFRSGVIGLNSSLCN